MAVSLIRRLATWDLCDVLPFKEGFGQTASAFIYQYQNKVKERRG